MFRNEVKLLLHRIEMDLNELICSEDVNLAELSKNCELDLTLVDHNILDSKLDRFSGKVVEIIDHHVDGGKYEWLTSEKRNIAFDELTGRALVGSTCTLIAERFSETLRSEPDIATLLLGVIALDTINMDSAAGIGTARDAEALRQLRLISPQNQDELFETLRGAKLDPLFWRNLTAAEVLRIDYKAFHSPSMREHDVGDIGIATALQPVREFLTKKDVFPAMEATLHAQNLSVLVVMSFVHHPVPTREMLVYTHDKDLYEALLVYLHNDGKGGEDQHDLRCVVIDVDPALSLPRGASLAVMAQQNAKASRKQVAPILLNFFNQNINGKRECVL